MGEWGWEGDCGPTRCLVTGRSAGFSGVWCQTVRGEGLQVTPRPPHTPSTRSRGRFGVQSLPGTGQPPAGAALAGRWQCGTTGTGSMVLAHSRPWDAPGRQGRGSAAPARPGGTSDGETALGGGGGRRGGGPVCLRIPGRRTPWVGAGRGHFQPPGCALGHRVMDAHAVCLHGQRRGPSLRTPRGHLLFSSGEWVSPPEHEALRVRAAAKARWPHVPSV